MARAANTEAIEMQMDKMHLNEPSRGASSNRRRGNKRAMAKNKVDNEEEEAVEVSAIEREIQFKTELVWCLNHLEERIQSLPDNSDGRRRTELIKAFNSLGNERLGIVQKRVIMSKHCGDYRQKMAQELTNFRRQHPCVSVLINNQTRKVNAAIGGGSPKGLVLKKRLKTSNSSNETAKAPSTLISNSSEFKFNLPNPSD